MGLKLEVQECEGAGTRQSKQAHLAGENSTGVASKNAFEGSLDGMEGNNSAVTRGIYVCEAVVAPADGQRVAHAARCATRHNHTRYG